MVNVRHIIKREREVLREKIRAAKRSRREAECLEKNQGNIHLEQIENRDLREMVTFLKNAMDDMRTELFVLTEAVESQTAYIKLLLKRNQNKCEDLESTFPLRSELELMQMNEEKTPQSVEIPELNEEEPETVRFPFPIRSEKDLMRIEDDITPANKETYVNIMKSLLSENVLSKSLKSIMIEKIIFDHNINGVSNKKSLNSYESFLSALLEAIQLVDSTQPAEKLLRGAMGRAKNNFNKKKNRYK
ncbi:uncharacterized protein LOC117780252 [Drosophila innubila]|uniref:uncharacterized protein LOC117780252 n=1 Tax=Drosophila innubila TaxID=198719 RepID=UPI00148B874E|nr:uncharacterized protein LOC117780252 [Drosophila innubila]